MNDIIEHNSLWNVVSPPINAWVNWIRNTRCGRIIYLDEAIICSIATVSVVINFGRSEKLVNSNLVFLNGLIARHPSSMVCEYTPDEKSTTAK